MGLFMIKNNLLRLIVCLLLDVLVIYALAKFGLIDDVGDANHILREKYGEDVVIKKFEKSKSWLSKKLSSSNDRVDQLANILDEKSVWQRYGL